MTITSNRMTITAKRKTAFKKDPTRQAADLQRENAGLVRIVEEGEVWPIERMIDTDARTDAAGHMEVELGHGAGRWHIYALHFDLPHHREAKGPKQAPANGRAVRWSDPLAPVSRWFAVQEFTLNDPRRIPTDRTAQDNIVRFSTEGLDPVREWWGAGLVSNSGYRPWDVNREIGSRSPNHPSGLAMDLRPIDGDIWGFQERFDAEWYNTGRWLGGFGLGAHRGFIHLDMREWGTPRRWGY